MNDLKGLWKRIVFKKIVPGDIRKLNAESNDAPTGGGARDFRFSPADKFFPEFQAMFPEVDEDNRLNAELIWSNVESRKTLIPPPTPSRGNEIRIAKIHECCPLSELPDDNQDCAIVFLQDDNGVHASFETVKSFAFKGLSVRLQCYLKNLLEGAHPANVTPSGFIDFEGGEQFSSTGETMNMNMFQPYSVFESVLAAIRAKPFILLAGMSGTGKTRIVRQLARGCCPTGSDLAKEPDHPGHYECIPVRPNWHDSTGLMGYVSRIDGAKYVVTDFVRFLAKAWLYEEEGIPFFLCLDEMNLAPVEQYFAEYLSVIESRRVKDGKIVSDPLVRIADEGLLKAAIDVVYKGVKHETAEKFKAFFVLQGGIPIPSNLVVMGTVNMDETTCSFPHKVLDRAMTFELNEFDIDSGLESNPDTPLGSIKVENAKGTFTPGWQVYAEAKDVCDKIKPYLVSVNAVLNGTKFKFAYRTRDEVMAYCVERMKDGTALVAALDEATSMKVLSRVEGDEQIVKRTWLEKLQTAIADGLKALCAEGEEPPKKCADKLAEMHKRLVDTGFTSFWA